jgi:hypothetical protein
MRIITAKRLIKAAGSKQRKKFSDVSRNYFDAECKVHFVLEALLFALIAIASAWPVYAAADAMSQLLQRT